MEKTLARTSTKKIECNLLSAAQQALEDRKALNLVVLPLQGKTDLADAFLIASASSKRHMHALNQAVTEKMKNLGAFFIIDGENSDEWIVVDAFHVVVHIFSHEAREKYNLESLWG